MQRPKARHLLGRLHVPRRLRATLPRHRERETTATERPPPPRLYTDNRPFEEHENQHDSCGGTEQMPATKTDLQTVDGYFEAPVLKRRPPLELGGKGVMFSPPFSRLPISSHVVTQFPLIVLDERSSLVEFSKSGPFPCDMLIAQLTKVK